MAEAIQWEYRVLTIGGALGTKDEQIEETLNEWGEDGWEAINVYTPSGSGKVTLVAKRPLTDSQRRRRNLPTYLIEVKPNVGKRSGLRLKGGGLIFLQEGDRLTLLVIHDQDQVVTRTEVFHRDQTQRLE
jgi:hypothetical protein